MHQPGIEPGPQPWEGHIVLFNYWCVLIAVSHKINYNRKDMHRPGIEPGPKRWQRPIVPFNHRRDICNGPGRTRTGDPRRVKAML